MTSELLALDDQLILVCIEFLPSLTIMQFSLTANRLRVVSIITYHTKCIFSLDADRTKHFLLQSKVIK